MQKSKIFLLIRSIPKTIYFNLKYFKLKDAIKLPVLVAYNVYLKETKGKITIENPKLFGVRIGFGGVGIFDRHYSRSIWQVSGKVIFKGTANIGHGSKILVSGTLEIGEDFKISAESSIICKNHILIGNDVLFSWENLVMDTDFHPIYNNENLLLNPDKEIIINDHVWVGCRCTILKGTIIDCNNIIASNSVITGKHIGQNTIIGGNPSKVIKKNVRWEHI